MLHGHESCFFAVAVGLQFVEWLIVLNVWLGVMLSSDLCENRLVCFEGLLFSEVFGSHSGSQLALFL